MPASKPTLTSVHRCIAVLAITLSSTLHAQTIIGTWQGTLPSGDAPRVVLKFVKADNGAPRGFIYLIDQDASGLPLLSVSFAAPNLSIAIGNLSYRGKLSADGKSITGTWIRGDQTYPLTFVLANPDTLWTSTGPRAVPPMSPTADPSFEIATIKPSRPDANNWGYETRTREFEARDNTVADLIKFAYQVRDRQIDGGPSWIHELKFDVVAKPDAPGQPSLDQERVMLKKLLADRFSLAVHNVQTVFPVYALTVEKSPPKLTMSDPSAHGHENISPHEEADGELTLQFSFTTMSDLANLLMNFIQDRQIVDETGLTGNFDFTMRIPANVLGGNQGSDDNDKAAAFIRALGPLGFKLVPKKEPLKVIVIDHVERPSPN